MRQSPDIPSASAAIILEPAAGSEAVFFEERYDVRIATGAERLAYNILASSSTAVCPEQIDSYSESTTNVSIIHRGR